MDKCLICHPVKGTKINFSRPFSRPHAGQYLFQMKGEPHHVIGPEVAHYCFRRLLPVARFCLINLKLDSRPAPLRLWKDD
jgi:hypothetical protein